jgi:hypothetical protein
MSYAHIAGNMLDIVHTGQCIGVEPKNVFMDEVTEPSDHFSVVAEFE